MEINEYLQQIEKARLDNDHASLLAAMQKFFVSIHTCDEKDGKLIGLYSMAQQLESMGVNADAIKEAVRARITSMFKKQPSTWFEVACSLNALLDQVGKRHLIIDVSGK